MAKASAGRNKPFLMIFLFLAAFAFAAGSRGAEMHASPGIPAARMDLQASAAPAAPTSSSSLPQDLQGSIRKVKPSNGRKLIALTFDLCETAGSRSGYDAAVVETLRENGIKATFFACGKWMLTHPEETMRLMADPLFEIGNHSWTHKNFRLLSKEEMEVQVQRTQAQYRSLRETFLSRTSSTEPDPLLRQRIPESISLFRFPYGTCNRDALDLLARQGLTAIQWSVVTGDASPGRTAEGIARTVMEKASPGVIIIGHANGRGHGTARSLPLFIPRLLESGYEFVTVSELLTLGSPVAAGECYELRPGDNLFYDAQFRNKHGSPR